MEKIKKFIHWMHSYDTIQGAANICLWIILLNIADIVITLFALQFDVTEKNPIFAKLFDAAHFELAIIIKLTVTLFAVGLILFSFIVSYNVRAAKKFNLIAHLCLFYAALFALFMYLFIVASNISTLVALFTFDFMHYIVIAIFGYAIGSYYATQLKADMAEN